MNYQKITSPDINNGLGCRVTLWISGCPHRCPGCHNSETWDNLSGKPFDDDAFSQLFDKLNKPYIKGLTLSGGEPLDLSNCEKLSTILEIIRRFRDRYGSCKDIWVFTGNQLKDLETNTVAKEILKEIDYLVDGRFEIKKLDKSLPFRGSSNQCIYKKNPKTGQFGIDEELCDIDVDI